MQPFDDTLKSTIESKSHGGGAELELSLGSRRSLVQFFLKRSLDVGLSLVFFFLFGPIYIVVWAGVLLTTGRPAIYHHMRVGRGGQEFACLKFRSMIKDSEEVLKKLLASNPSARKEWETSFKLKNDPRVTRFGRFIRKTSLDELPQFWNVLRGDMSIVGPRPVTRGELERYYGPVASLYETIRPGITGPWQVGGRSNLDYSERIRLDSMYAKNWSVWGDFKLIAKTVVTVLGGKGSY